MQLLAKAGRLEQFDSQHIAFGMRVFINPAVAGLRQHHHLFSGWGCYNDKSIDNSLGGTECKGVDALPSDYIPLLDCLVDKDKKSPREKNNEIWKCQPDKRATIPKGFEA